MPVTADARTAALLRRAAMFLEVCRQDELFSKRADRLKAVNLLIREIREALNEKAT